MGQAIGAGRTANRRVVGSGQSGKFEKARVRWAFLVNCGSTERGKGIERKRGLMSSSGKKRQTFSKMTRERTVKEKRERKQEKKEEKKAAAAAALAEAENPTQPEAVGEDELGEDREPDA